MADAQDRMRSPSGDATGRAALRANWVADEGSLVRSLAAAVALDAQARERIVREAARLISLVRSQSAPTLMETLLGEYGLSTQEGVGLMCLAEALLRVPDPETIDALISDKIEPGNWGAHLGKSSSSLVNAATWALLLTGKVLDDDAAWPSTVLRGLVRRLGEPVVRSAVSHAIKLLGDQFVLGESMEKALERARPMEARGYTYSYDMLGEAARTYADAARYHAAYMLAIASAAAHATGDIRTSPGISVKLSALHPRYEWLQRERVMRELVPSLVELARQSAHAGIGLNIDAEEANRLEVSLDVIERVLADPALRGWDGFGVVVQAYGRRALPLIDAVHGMALSLGRRIMVRLVKGAYWDSEIKQAQALGLAGFPVYTRKAHTDVSYLACARALMDRNDRIYAQFATHNAHTLAAIREMAAPSFDYEFQRLHGMGENLHAIVKTEYSTRCRIYAPVGAHRDLLAYLVRRLLENGANSSFVHQMVDASLAPEDIARDPITAAFANSGPNPSGTILQPSMLYRPRRANSQGADFNEPASALPLLEARTIWKDATWQAAPTIDDADGKQRGDKRKIVNPAVPGDRVGEVVEANKETAAAAVTVAIGAFRGWTSRPASERAGLLRAAANAYEANRPELISLATREAGKTLSDAMAEVREAVDFLNYYAGEIERLDAERHTDGRGVVVCISPWNFPLAIFTGQVAAALAAGNTVIAKPAEQTPLIAHRAVQLMHSAGIPRDVLVCLPGDGERVAAPLTADPRIAGVVFTGSTEVARAINRSLRANAGPRAALIAETGGLNAMIVDSTALTEQAVRDVIASSFQSAGQRCSALRMLYLQEDIYHRTVEMLFGAMDTLIVGDPWQPSTDVGPVIDEAARADIADYCANARSEGRMLKSIAAPATGTFIGPTVISVKGIEDLPREVFGPVLHLASYKASDLEAVVAAINSRNYGLTFGLSTRIDDRVEQVVGRIRCGNIYVNRNQIGAIVGSQPFGGEGLSGTGPKAGGPHYVERLRARPEEIRDPACAAEARRAPRPERAEVERKLQELAQRQASWAGRADRLDRLRAAIGEHASLLAEAQRFDEAARAILDLPGPTGESNRLSLHARGVILCLGPSVEQAMRQAVQALATGNAALIVGSSANGTAAVLSQSHVPVAAIDGCPVPQLLAQLEPLHGVMCSPDHGELEEIATALAGRTGMIVPLILSPAAPDHLMVERHLCIDTTASGGNAALLAAADAA